MPGGLQELIHHAAASGSYQRLSERFSEERLSGAWVFICGYLAQHLQGGRLSISTASPAHVVGLAHLEALHSIHDWTVQGESCGWAGWLQHHLVHHHLGGHVALQLAVRHTEGQGRAMPQRTTCWGWLPAVLVRIAWMAALAAPQAPPVHESGRLLPCCAQCWSRCCSSSCMLLEAATSLSAVPRAASTAASDAAVHLRLGQEGPAMAAAVCVLLEPLRSHPDLQRLSLGLGVVSGQLCAPDPGPAVPAVEVGGCCMAAAVHRLAGAELCFKRHKNMCLLTGTLLPITHPSDRRICAEKQVLGFQMVHI